VNRKQQDDENELAEASNISGPATKKSRIDTAIFKKTTRVRVAKKATPSNKVGFYTSLPRVQKY
jgi:mannose-1-phosphate guanylyltransferase